MSKNASRHGAGLKTLAQSTGYAPEVHKAILAQEAKQEADIHARKGKGVAWVQGREYRMPMPSVYYVSRKFAIVC